MKKISVSSPNIHLFLLIIFFLLIPFSISTSSSPDYEVLLSFKSSSDSSNSLFSWSSGDPCTGNWAGVSCKNNRVTRLILQSFNLSGPIHSLTKLDQLRVLSLKNNSFNSTLPNDFSPWKDMKLLYLSHNHFSGEIPAAISQMRRLRRLDLAYNNLTGKIPLEISRIRELLTLRLDHNLLSGTLTVFELTSPPLEDFNISGNNITGNIPASISTFPASSFTGNFHLCGLPLPNKCDAHPKPMSRIPITTSAPEKHRKFSAVAIVIADLVALAITIWVVFYCCYWNRAKRSSTSSSPMKAAKKIKQSSGITSTGLNLINWNYRSSSSSTRRRNELTTKEAIVFFNGGGGGDHQNKKGYSADGFLLDDLLRASAEMLGKGSIGSTYKATMEDGVVVVVKRVRERVLGGREKKSVHQQMQVLGSVRNPNVVSLKGYYCSEEEMLLVYDYFPNGSLHSLLHGNRGPGRTPLDWTTRLSLALDSARGLSYIHHACKSKLYHGHVTSSNILIHRSGNACLTDLSLSQFLTFSPKVATHVGTTMPDQVLNQKTMPSQKSDVYSLGVVLLEILTGKLPMFNGKISLPKWVMSHASSEWNREVFDLELIRYKEVEEDIAGLMRVALQCVHDNPHQRPKMSQVVKLIEGIKEGRGARGADCNSLANDNSSNSSHSVSGDTVGTSTIAG